MSEPVHIISLGAGVQSSCMSLMAAHGEITPMPHCAIFADTQAEPASVYRWLDWLEKQMPFPVVRVSKGSLEAEGTVMRVSKNGRVYSRTDIPFYTRTPDGRDGKIRNRSCTADYKIKPLLKESRKIAGIKRGQKTVGVVQWIGISLDEVQRMKPSREPWAECRWPLVEMRMTRQKCLTWMEEHGYPTPPRSACVFCPFHNRAEWRRLQLDEPEEFERAVKFEKAVQDAKRRSDNTDAVPYLHRSCQPIETIDFRSDVERGQKVLDFEDDNSWQGECEGMCGV